MTDTKDQLDAATRRELFKAQVDHPEPQQVHAAGITTEKTLEWERQTPPPKLSLEMTPEGNDYKISVSEANEEHQERVAEKAAQFRARAKDVKERFTMGHDAPSRRHQYDR